jgi:predicted helicase
MTVFEILSDIRNKAFAGRDKGFRFKKLMRAWLLTDPLYATALKIVCICSDEGISKAKGSDDSADALVDLALPVSTNVNSVAAQLREHGANPSRTGLAVVFSTYQSIAVTLLVRKGGKR